MPEAQEHSVTDAVVTHASTQVDVRVLENQPSNTIEGIVNERVDEKAEITRIDEASESDGYIDPPKPLAEISSIACLLPPELDLEWSSINLMNDSELEELQAFLSENYVESLDEDGGFRMRYSQDFLRWALCTPGYHPDWHIPVRAKNNKQLVAFVSSVPITVRVRENVIQAREMNFLCIHKMMRGRRLTPLLLGEALRRAQLKGAHCNFWTSGNNLPGQISACRYFHRPLNITKLVDVGFYEVPRSQTLEDLATEYALPEKAIPLVAGLREMETRDVAGVTALYAKYICRFDLSIKFTPEEIQHHLMGSMKQGSTQHERSVWTYVVEDPQTQAITDFFSFFSTPYTILGANSTQYEILNLAYLYFYATEVASWVSEDDLQYRLNVLMESATYIVKEHGFDVLNALTVMDNLKFMKNLKFKGGDGILKYYLDNWRTTPLAGMQPTDDTPAGMGIGVVML